MKYSDGLFLRVAREVAKEYEGRVDFDDRIIDAFCMNMVTDPSQFDVVVFPNLYGDIASDLAAGLVGGLGIAPGANIGKEYAVFEAVHGSAPNIAGQNKAESHCWKSSLLRCARPSWRARGCLARIRRAVT